MKKKLIIFLFIILGLLLFVVHTVFWCIGCYGPTFERDMTMEQLTNHYVDLFDGCSLSSNINPCSSIRFFDSTERELSAEYYEVISFGFMSNKVDNNSFSYQWSYSGNSSCDAVINDTDINIRGWFNNGYKGEAILGYGELFVGKSVLKVLKGTPPCTYRLRLDVMSDNELFASDVFDVWVR